MLSLDLVERDRLDEAASYVVELLGDPAARSGCSRARWGWTRRSWSPGTPTTFELEPVERRSTPAPSGPSTAARASSPTGGPSRSPRSGPPACGSTTDRTATSSGRSSTFGPSPARRERRPGPRRAGGAPAAHQPERLPELQRPVDAFREWAEWRAGRANDREAAAGDLVLVDGSLHGGPLVPQHVVHRVHEVAVARDGLARRRRQGLDAVLGSERAARHAAEAARRPGGRAVALGGADLHGSGVRAAVRRRHLRRASRPDGDVRLPRRRRARARPRARGARPAGRARATIRRSSATRTRSRGRTRPRG